MSDPVRFDILCAVARAELDADATARLDDAAARMDDWDALPDLLVHHGLTVLGARQLERVRDRVPADTWEEIRRRARAAHATSLALAGELRRIVETFDGADVPVLPFKGPVLAWRAYGDLGARPFVDLDLLVRPPDVSAAIAALGALGYIPTYHFTERQDAWFRRVDGDYAFVHPDTDCLVELHARAVSLRFEAMPPVEALWARRTFVPLAGRQVPVLSADDCFLLQALHGGKHRWERLEWVAVVAELLRQRGGDVASVLSQAPGARRAILLACTVASRWLRAPLSADMRARCARDPSVERLAATAWRRIASDAVDEGPEETAGKLAFNSRLQRGVAARARFAYRWAFWPSPEDWEFLPLPDALFFAYRVVRPLRLIGRYGRRARRAVAPADA